MMVMALRMARLPGGMAEGFVNQGQGVLAHRADWTGGAGWAGMPRVTAVLTFENVPLAGGV